MRLSQLSLRHCKYRCGRDRRGEVRTIDRWMWLVGGYGDGLCGGGGGGGGDGR